MKQWVGVDVPGNENRNLINLFVKFSSSRQLSKQILKYWIFYTLYDFDQLQIEFQFSNVKFNFYSIFKAHFL